MSRSNSKAPASSRGFARHSREWARGSSMFSSSGTTTETARSPARSSIWQCHCQGVRASPAELEQLFATFDPDRSGTVDYRELNAQLRHIATGAHTKPLTSLAYRAKNRYAPRKLAHVPSSASVEELIKAEIEDAKRASTWFSKPEQSNKNAIAALRGKLSENASSAIDLLRQWDQDGSGAVSRDEFQNAIKFLGIKCSAADIDGLFEEMDTDRSGELSLREINRDLRRGAAGEVAMILPSSATKDADASRVEDAGAIPRRWPHPLPRGAAPRLSTGRASKPASSIPRQPQSALV